MTVGRIPVIEGGIQPTIFDAKADLLTATANDTPARLAVGANDTILMADSTAATGLKWAGTYTDYTPTVTSGTGTLTTASATSRYLRIGNLIHWFGKVTITTAGTGAGALRVTTPVSRIGSFNIVGFGEETASVGFPVFMIINTNTYAEILKTDYTTAIGSGRGIDFNITYEVA